MNIILAKTLGGLTPQYYVRQFLFGLIFPALFVFVESQTHKPMQISMILMFTINTLLYPYARFVYESVVDYILGRNIFILPAFLMLFVKLIMMAACWSFAIFIAPIGLVYLYFHHGKPRG